MKLGSALASRPPTALQSEHRARVRAEHQHDEGRDEQQPDGPAALHGHGGAEHGRGPAHGVHGDLRVVGARLDADVAAADRGFEHVSGEGRQLVECRRLPVGDPETIDPIGGAEEGGAEADGDREVGRTHQHAALDQQRPHPAVAAQIVVHDRLDDEGIQGSEGRGLCRQRVKIDEQVDGDVAGHHRTAERAGVSVHGRRDDRSDVFLGRVRRRVPL